MPCLSGEQRSRSDICPGSFYSEFTLGMCMSVLVLVVRVLLKRLSSVFCVGLSMALDTFSPVYPDSRCKLYFLNPFSPR